MPRLVLPFSPRFCRARRWRAAALILILSAAGLAACHQATTRGRWTLTLKTNPKVPVAGQPTRFLLHVNRAHGQPLDGARAQLALNMSFMDMGANVVQLAPQGDGNYAGSGQFSMSGDWDCHARVELGGVQRVRTFHYKVD